MMTEEYYYMQLRLYLGKKGNKGKKQYDFLIEKIDLCQSRIDELKKSFENIDKKVLDEMPKIYSSKKDKKTYLEFNLEKAKDDLNSQIGYQEKHILYFEYKLDSVSIPKKTAKSLLIDGMKINISERYKIIQEVFGVSKKLRQLNISATEKHKLLAYTLGCNQQVARELFNGTQQERTRVRNELIQPYIDDILN